jgi:hypothetical protein
MFLVETGLWAREQSMTTGIRNKRLILWSIGPLFTYFREMGDWFRKLLNGISRFRSKRNRRTSRYL